MVARPGMRCPETCRSRPRESKLSCLSLSAVVAYDVALTEVPESCAEEEEALEHLREMDEEDRLPHDDELILIPDDD